MQKHRDSFNLKIVNGCGYQRALLQFWRLEEAVQRF